MSDNKYNLFADLSVGSNEKYKSYNDNQVTLERIAKVDGEINTWSKKERNLKWAKDYVSFYIITKKENQDILPRLQNQSVMESDYRAATAIIEEDERKKKEAEIREEEQRKRQEELRKKRLKESAEQVDQAIESLSSAPRTQYWIQDVSNLCKQVDSMDTASRAFCRKLDVLQELTEEFSDIESARAFDDRVRKLEEGKANSPEWIKSVKALKITANQKKHCKTFDIYASLLSTAEEFTRINEEIKRKAEREEAKRKELEKRKAEELKAQKERERIQRENEEKRIKEAKRKAEEEKKLQLKKEQERLESQIVTLTTGTRNEYWIQKVKDLVEQIAEWEKTTGLVCRKKNTLQKLELEFADVQAAVDFDDKVKDLERSKRNTPEWIKSVRALKILVKQKKYSKTLDVYDSLLSAAEQYQKTNEENRTKAYQEEQRRQKEEREKAENEKRRQEAKRRREAKLRHGIPTIVSLILAIVFIVLGLTMKNNQTYYLAVGIATGSVAILDLLSSLLTFVFKWFYRIGKIIKDFLLICGPVAGAFVLNSLYQMPLYAIALCLGTTAYAVKDYIGCAKLRKWAENEENSEAKGIYTMWVSFDSYFILFVGTSLFTLIGLTYLSGCFTPILVGSALLLLSIFVGASFYVLGSFDSDGIAALNCVISVLGLLAGIVLLFFSREDTIYGIFTIVSAFAIFLFTNLRVYEQDWIDALYAIPLGVSMLVMFCHWGAYDEVIKNNVLTAYYGISDTYVVSDNVETIGKNAIKGAAKKKLQNLTISKNVTEIGESSFARVKNLVNVQFDSESKLTVIGAYAFLNTPLSNFDLDNTLRLPDSVRIIGEKAFDSTGFKTVYLGSSLERLWSACFSSSSIKEIYYNGTAEMWTKVDKFVSKDGFWSMKSWDYNASYTLYVKDSAGNYVRY